MNSPQSVASDTAICPYCSQRFALGGLSGYVYCPACGKRFNPGSLLEDTVVMTPAMRTAVLVPSPAEAETAEFPAVAVDEESEARRFGDYDILSEIARGGMGVVYRARHRLLKRIVALKVLRAGDGASQDDISRFMQEAKAVASLSHPNIVPIHELSVEKGQYYFTMNYIDGWSLDQIIERRKLSPYRACEIIETIARAIHYAHTKGIIHRDIKPANVIMSEDNRPMVTDFGLAINLAGSREEQRMTRDGSVMGTIPYIPPEQASGRLEDIGPRSDVYSLGALFYEMLTARPPFTGMTQYELLQRVINQYPPAPRKLNPRINADLDTICMKCLAKEPERRYQTALALAEDCRSFLNGDVIKARPTTFFYWAERLAKRYPMHTVLIAVVVALGLALLAILNFASKTQKELVIKADEHQQTVVEKKKLDERVERQWREDFRLQLGDDRNITRDITNARNQQLCWINPRTAEVRDGKLFIKPAGGGRNTALGIPVNLPLRYRLNSKLMLTEIAAGSAQLEILLGADREFRSAERSTLTVVIGTRGNPGARLLANNTVLCENNTFFLEPRQEYSLEISQGGGAGTADDDIYQQKTFTLLADGEEILSSVVPSTAEMRPEAFFALASRGLSLELTQFNINIPGLNQEMIKSLLEIGNSFSDKPEERSLARLLYRRVLRERVPVSVLLQVYLGFAKTTMNHRWRNDNVKWEFERLTDNLRQSRGERIFPGEIDYGYGLVLAVGRKPEEAEQYFREAYRKAQDAARRRLVPQTAVWVGAFQAYNYSPASAPGRYDAREVFVTLSGAGQWQNFNAPDFDNNYVLPAGTTENREAKCYAMFVYSGGKGDRGRKVEITYPADCRLWLNGILQIPSVKSNLIDVMSTTRLTPGKNYVLLELPATLLAQKFAFAVEENSWEAVNVFGLLARLDEALATLARGDYVNTAARLDKLQADGVVDILRDKYATELQVRAGLAGVWRRIDDLLHRSRRPAANLLSKDSDVALAMRIIDIVGNLEPVDAVRGKELAKRYCEGSDIYLQAVLQEKRASEREILLQHSRRLLKTAGEIAPDWYLPAFKQAAFMYCDSTTRTQAAVLFREITAKFADSIELRQDITEFYLRNNNIDFDSGKQLPPAPSLALPIISEAASLSGRKNVRVMELLAETLLALGDADQAWHVNAEARAIETTPELRSQLERIDARRKVEAPRQPQKTP